MKPALACMHALTVGSMSYYASFSNPHKKLSLSNDNSTCYALIPFCAAPSFHRSCMTSTVVTCYSEGSRKILACLLVCKLQTRQCTVVCNRKVWKVQVRFTEECGCSHALHTLFTCSESPPLRKALLNARFHNIQDPFVLWKQWPGTEWQTRKVKI